MLILRLNDLLNDHESNDKINPSMMEIVNKHDFEFDDEIMILTHYFSPCIKRNSSLW